MASLRAVSAHLLIVSAALVAAAFVLFQSTTTTTFDDDCGKYRLNFLWRTPAGATDEPRSGSRRYSSSDEMRYYILNTLPETTT